MKQAFKLEIAVNPLLRVELPKVEKPEARSLTSDEVQRLREVCRYDFTFVEIALATGARRGELLALKWPDVDYITTTRRLASRSKRRRLVSR